MGTTGSFQWSLFIALLATLAFGFTFAHGSHGSRGRAGAGAGHSVLRPGSLMLLEGERGDQADQSGDDANVDLDQLLNLLQANGAKGKRSQDLADRGLTRDLVAQVLQPGSGAGMWFGPRLGRRRRREAAPSPTPSTTRRRKRDADEDDDIPWKLAELLREMQGSKRSPTPCDPAEINCLLANIANGAGGYASSEEQRPRSDGNLVNFTPRLGRDSGEQGDQGEPGNPGNQGGGFGPSGRGDNYLASSRQLRTDSEPVWGFSPRLGRRLLPPGTVDVHAPANAPPASPVASPASPRPRPRAGRASRASRSADDTPHAQ